MTSTDHIAKLNTFARKVAYEMGVWSVSQPATIDRPSCVTLSNGDADYPITGASFDLFCYPGETRVRVSGNYADQVPGVKSVYLADDERPGISVGFDRNPQAVAADIARRFMPAYAARAVKVREAVAASNTAESGRRSTLDTLADALGVDHVDHDPNRRNGPIETVRIMTAGAWGDFRPNHNGSEVNIDLHSVPVELALQIAALLRP